MNNYERMQAEPRCLPEIWHVQVTKNGGYVGYYQWFHPNEEAARIEAERLRHELPWADVHIGRYVLDKVESMPRPGSDT